VPAPAPPEDVPAPEAVHEPEAELIVVEEIAEPEFAPEPAADPAEPVGSVGEDVEGARLIALNMALNGTAREETDRYLAENFDLSDRAALLNEVYASVEG
jgi:hypothetical protein